ncbi:WD40 domain-containing protein [Rhizoctonia solani AG-1 IA]|uniref:WD40 domain-containing protein n=1 Tax=Thanatephorus cucumeris (strain AG1-IA) TaxID=983506 RepID=L8WED6_THACA|nr:WD40 domain-containing protein [Rhizoctonia solani AG-1 IA]
MTSPSGCGMWKYSPDETCIASCSYDGPIRIYDATTGETRLVVQPPEEHRSPISSIRYSPDGVYRCIGTWSSSGPYGRSPLS